MKSFSTFKRLLEVQIIIFKPDQTMQFSRALLLLLMVFTTFSLKSQSTTSKHLAFKGVPIDGTLNEYVTKMKAAGFKLEGVEDGLALFTGDFAAYKDCMIGVRTLDGMDLVNKVTVIFPDVNTWSRLESNYSDLKELLTIKYGEPDRVNEEFEGTLPPRDDSSKMHELVMERCKYWSSFELENGIIQVSIEYSGNAFVMLAYWDKINS